MDTRPVVRDADDAAAAACRAWLIALGLAAEIDAVRFPDDGGPVPAPGLDALRRGADLACRDAHDLAERAHRLAGDPDAVDEPALLSAVERAEQAADAAERAGRLLAQLALGVSAHLAPSDHVSRLDRAATAVLHPPPGAGEPVPLADDNVGEILAGTRRERIVEVAGILGRLLLDRGTIELAVAHASLWFTVEDDDVLVSGDKRWESPVTLLEPATWAVDELSTR